MFNRVVALDCLEVPWKGKKYWFLNCVDHGTNYQVLAFLGGVLLLFASVLSLFLSLARFDLAIMIIQLCKIRPDRLQTLSSGLDLTSWMIRPYRLQHSDHRSRDQVVDVPQAPVLRQR